MNCPPPSQLPSHPRSPQRQAAPPSSHDSQSNHPFLSKAVSAVKSFISGGSKKKK